MNIRDFLYICVFKYLQGIVMQNRKRVMILYFVNFRRLRWSNLLH